MRVRSLFKTGVSAPLAWSGAAALIGQATGKRSCPLILGYHRVVEDFASARAYGIDASLVSVKTLERQIDWVARRYEICPLDELDPLELARRRSRPRAALTFDDGYADVYRNALPLLSRKGLPFAVFIAPDLVGTSELFLHDELYLRLSALSDLRRDAAISQLTKLLCRIGYWAAISAVFPTLGCDPYRLTRAMLGTYRQAQLRQIVTILRSQTELPRAALDQSRVMDWRMVQGLHHSGVLIGCHSRSHAILTNEAQDTVASEVQGGRQRLERHLGARVEHFAYPDGAFDATTINAVANAGYRYAYTVCFHREAAAPQFTVPRRIMWERSNVNALGRFSCAILACQVSGLYDGRPACSAPHG